MGRIAGTSVHSLVVATRLRVVAVKTASNARFVLRLKIIRSLISYQHTCNDTYKIKKTLHRWWNDGFWESNFESSWWEEACNLACISSLESWPCLRQLRIFGWSVLFSMQMIISTAAGCSAAVSPANNATQAACCCWVEKLHTTSVSRCAYSPIRNTIFWTRMEL